MVTEKNFTVICFPPKTVIGTLLAETDKTETIQAQLFAVNNGLSDRPMPELMINFPLADMDQKFFAKDITRRLLRVGSIFDETCKITYQIDGQSQKSEEWLCSSFLKHFDKYTGQPKLYYELRIRPAALRADSDKNLVVDASQDWFDLFKNLKNSKELNISRVDLLNDELPACSTLDLTGYDRWINRLIDVYYIDTPTIDTSAYDKMADQISDRYPAGEFPAGEKVYGPFDPMVCKVNRYVKYMDETIKQSLYPDMFLVDCNYLRYYGQKFPAWAFEIFLPKGAEDPAASLDSKKSGIDLSFRLQGVGISGFILINDISTPLPALAITILNYQLTEMPPDFFNSRVVRDTLHSAGRLEAPCTVSYMADGKLVSQEKLKCDLSYQVHDDINVNISVDYGFKKCSRHEDKACQKGALMKAASFLKEIKDVPQEIVMKIEFDGGEAVTAGLDLSNFDLAAINHLLNRIELFD